MNTSDQKPKNHKWSEGDVDRFLTGFFAAEMPVDLRPAQPVLQTAEPKRSSAAIWGGMLAAAAALMIAVGVTRSTGNAPDANNGIATAPVQEDSVEQFKTEDGTIELKTRFVENDVIEFEYDISADGFEFDADNVEPSMNEKATESPEVPEDSSKD